MRYVTSDLHFYHKNILKLQPETRPWGDMESMRDGLVHEINSLPNCEMLYHLGDFCFAGVTKLREILDSIKVPMVFIKGNHDGEKLMKVVQNEYGFPVHNYYETKHNGRKIVMFHFPIWRDWNMAQHGSIHWFAHLHGRKTPPNGKSLDIGWDAHGKILTFDEATEIADHNEILTFHEQPKLKGGTTCP